MAWLNEDGCRMFALRELGKIRFIETPLSPALRSATGRLTAFLSEAREVWPV